MALILQEKKFNSEEVTAIIKEIIENTLGDAEYSHAKVATWSSNIIEGCLNKLKSMNSNYKYVVTCVILQNKGTGFYTGSSVYWDNQNDGSASYRHESRSLYALVNVFALNF
ncbi:Tctex-1 [Gilbertella persicaria]|uniref:Dynein light chain Tctex-type n=1 Tax=Rhizopus stolonifer TaxID=4846 RepID=A0A367KJT7_RHIST|nr:Tctex-1 [Gilbertella persicaria]KAI8097853.1 Tctex-1 [Gilbertella persicaria]RCI02437.1 Dynein light chain Tctex-type [Rhizopus stolonifer]